MNSQKKYDVFISYSRKDLDEISTFVEMLKTRIPTLEVWMDLEGITAADEFDEKIISAIDASSYVIFAVSPNSNSIGEGSSEWTKKELVYAKNTGKKVIPVLLSGAELNSWFLFEFGRVDCIDSTSTHQIEKLLKNIAKWSNKNLVKPKKEKKVLTIDEQQLLNEARTFKDRIEKTKRVAKIALIAILALLVLTIPTIFGINRYKAYKAIQYTVINDSVAPYTIEISGFELVNGYNPKKISIPKKIKKNDTTYLVTSIGSEAFMGCSSLTSITIPNSVTSIGEKVFCYCTSLTSITIPNSVKSIGERAFGWCRSLTSITIPNSVTWIANEVFYDCSSLTSVAIPNSVIEIGSSAFSGCESLISITIPNSVIEIGSSAFIGCSSLTSITIPNSVTSIGDWAFAECSSLNLVTIPSSTKSIGGKTFVGTALYNDPSNWENGALYINECLTAVDTNFVGNCIIKENTRLIGEVAFISCSSLTSVTIPNSVTSIGDGTFGYCSALTSITVDADNTHYDSRNDCNAIIETATNTLIAGCQNTIIPNSVTSIGEDAFLGCELLTSITIPNGVKSIEQMAFSHCSSLTSITIPNSVTSIGGWAFEYCSSLTSITIPNSVKSIGELAFYYCSSLTSITIPNSVTSIGRWAFDYCYLLTEINYTGTIQQWDDVIKEEKLLPAKVVHCTNGDVKW